MKNIVVIGGGTGLSKLLQGLKDFDDVSIASIVAVSDNGTSTGILSRHFSIPAVGDLRRVISSLSSNREELESIMNFRFKDTNTDLDGHAIGNLLITSSILNQGDFAGGIQAVCKMLNIKGAVIPVSNQFYDLKAELTNGEMVVGESKIGKSYIGIKTLAYDRGAIASASAINAILQADYIILGIGSLYTSLIANLIYPNIQIALKKTHGKVLYFANLFTQHGETDNMGLNAHVMAIEQHAHKGFIDEIVVSSTPIEEAAIEAYAADHQTLVKNDYHGHATVTSLDLAEILAPNLVKHSTVKLRKAFAELLQ